MKLRKSDLIKAFQEYLDDARELHEGKNLPGMTVTEQEAVDLFNDFVTYAVEAGTVENDSTSYVTTA